MPDRTRLLPVPTAIIAATVMLAILAAPAAAQSGQDLNETAPYYNDTEDDVSATGWLPGENATLGNVLDLATRLGPRFVGHGSEDPSGSGLEGVLLMGLLIGGVTLSSILGVGVGPVGGSILGMVVGYGVVDLGFAPVWLKPVLLLGLGVAAAVALRRAIQ